MPSACPRPPTTQTHPEVKLHAEQTRPPLADGQPTRWTANWRYHDSPGRLKVADMSRTCWQLASTAMVITSEHGYVARWRARCQ